MKLDDSMKEHIERRIDFALGRFAARVARVSVTIEDAGGPGGGIKKRCCILVKLDRMEEIVVEGTNAEFYDAVALAADRVGRSVQRRLDRRRTIRRSGRRPEDHDREETEPTPPSA